MIAAYQYAWAAPLLDRYNRYLLRKSFARVRVAGLDVLRASERSLILAPNHSCWWDGCVDLFLSRVALRRRSYLLMGEPELRKYRIFSSMGVFNASLRYITAELRRHPGSHFWIYPQGEMLPARAPLVLREGALLASEHSGAPIVPLAQRYEFLRDDHPEVLIRVGMPIAGLTRRDGRAGIEALRDAMVDLLLRLDCDIATAALDAYEPVLVGAETRSERLQRLRETRA